MRKIFIYLILTVAVTLSASEIKWAKDYDAGIKEAKKILKPVFFVSSSHSCKYCVMLERRTFSDKRVIKELNKDFVTVISYNDEQDYIPKELWQPGTPAMWFLLPSGVPMYQPLMGAIDADNFLKALAIVKEEFDKRKKK